MNEKFMKLVNQAGTYVDDLQNGRSDFSTTSGKVKAIMPRIEKESAKHPYTDGAIYRSIKANWSILLA